MKIHKSFAPIIFTILCSNTILAMQSLEKELQSLHDINGNTALHRAASSGSVDELKSILRSETEVNMRTKDPLGMTALCIAAYYGYLAIVTQLLDAGADVDKPRADDGATPLFMAAQMGHLPVVEKLLEADAYANKPRTDDGTTPLYIAAQNGHDSVVKQLLKANADVHKTTTDDDITPLYIAACRGHSPVVKQLLKAGADTDVDKPRTDDGATPLFMAAQRGHLPVVEQLLKAGANANKTKTNDGATPLFIAAQEGRTSVVEKLLKAGADVDRARNNDGMTPLHIAVKKDKIEVVELLLAHKANPTLQKKCGKTPFELTQNQIIIDFLVAAKTIYQTSSNLHKCSIKEAQTTSCCNIFRAHPIEEWKKHKLTCPLCMLLQSDWKMKRQIH